MESTKIKNRTISEHLKQANKEIVGTAEMNFKY